MVTAINKSSFIPPDASTSEFKEYFDRAFVEVNRNLNSEMCLYYVPVRGPSCFSKHHHLTVTIMEHNKDVDHFYVTLWGDPNQESFDLFVKEIEKKLRLHLTCRKVMDTTYHLKNQENEAVVSTDNQGYLMINGTRAYQTITGKTIPVKTEALGSKDAPKSTRVVLDSYAKRVFFLPIAQDKESTEQSTTVRLFQRRNLDKARMPPEYWEDHDKYQSSYYKLEESKASCYETKMMYDRSNLLLIP